MKHLEEDAAVMTPCVKLASCGIDSLSDAELLSIVIDNGSAGALAVSQNLLEKSGGSLSALAALRRDEFLALEGMTPARARRFKASLALAERLADADPVGLPYIFTSRDAAGIIAPRLRLLAYEECWIMLLNRSNRLISMERMSIGGVHATTIDIKMILKRAIDRLASAIILVHNHPSGSARPGEADCAQTQALRQAAASVDIDLMDHIIIAGRKYYSFADEGILKLN